MRPTAVHHRWSSPTLIFATYMKQWQNQYNTERVSISMEFRFETIDKRHSWLALLSSSRCCLFPYGARVSIAITIHGLVFIFIFSLRLRESNFTVYKFILRFFRYGNKSASLILGPLLQTSMICSHVCCN